MNKDLFINLAQGFGLGRVEFAPGTVASFVTCIIFYPILQFPLWIKIAIILGLTVLGIYGAELAEEKIGEEDPRSVVIDEIVGQFILLVFIPHLSYAKVFVGFILFRLLDVFKPPPIGYVEEKLSGGIGIMMDDIVAGIIGGLILMLLFSVI